MLIQNIKNSAFGQKFALILVPAILWAALFYLRTHFYSPTCGLDPSSCTIEQVNSLDRLVFEFGSKRADFWSNVVQNTVGGIAFLLPWLIYPHREWRTSLSEMLTLGQAAVWNGVFLEIVRALAQRPRPLVFHSPTTDGMNIHQYTSFYSGHTSFVALASFGMWLMIRKRFPRHLWLHLNFLLLFFSFTLLTGALRVMGGRHFPTDVLAGAFFGVITAMSVWRFYDQNQNKRLSV